MKTRTIHDDPWFGPMTVNGRIPGRSRPGRFLKPVSLKAGLAGLATVLLGLSLSVGPARAESDRVKYSRVRVEFTDQADLQQLAKTGIALDGIDFEGGYFDAVLNDTEVSILKRAGRRFSVEVDDMEAEHQKRPRKSAAEWTALETEMSALYAPPSNFKFGSMGGFLTLEEVVEDLDLMKAAFPGLITVRQSIGSSIENREIWMVKVSANPDVDEDEPEVLYTGLHHGREPQSMTTLVYFMWYLLENYGDDPTVTDLLNTRELYFVPVVNPDGYKHNETTNPGGGGMWRKNRRANADGTYGVDLNRNYGYNWGYDNTGSSPTTTSETYRGTAAFSEPEVRALRDFVTPRTRLTTAVHVHSYGNIWIFPWEHKANIYTEDHPLFLGWCADMTQFNQYGYGSPLQAGSYVVNGGANDWYYGEQVAKHKIYCFVAEVGSNSDGFWPVPERIIPLADENVYPNLRIAAGWDGPLPVITLPASPSNLKGTAQARTGIALTWTDNSSNEDFFVVERRLGTAPWIEITTLKGNTTTYQDRTVAARTTYTYRVHGSNFAGRSLPSNLFTIKAK
jgi:hypothetical protein